MSEPALMTPEEIDKFEQKVAADAMCVVFHFGVGKELLHRLCDQAKLATTKEKP